MYTHIRYTLVLVLFLSSVSTFAQTKISLAWDDKVSLMENAPALYFEGARYGSVDAMLPFYSDRIRVANGGFSLNIVNAQFEPLANTAKVSSDVMLQISDDINLNQSIQYERGQAFLVYSFSPIRKNPSTGQLERMVSFETELRSNPQIASPNVEIANFVNSSVLASGNWFKIGVTQTGMHALNADFLRTVGFDLNTLNPRNIRIYGNGGDALPQPNASPRSDDLVENAIIVTGESDGRFDAGDLVLFYATGPISWVFDTNLGAFVHRIHPYSDTAYYFITNSLGAGKRMQLQASVNQTPNQTVSTFDDFRVHETENYNIVKEELKSGREYYGEEFEFTSSYDFNFSFPDIVPNSEVRVRTDVIARSNVQTTFNVRANDAPLYNIVMGTVPLNFETDFARPRNLSGTFTNSNPSIKITVAWTKPNSVSNAWLNYIEVIAKRQLRFSGNQLSFRDINSVGSGNISEFILSNAPQNITILDVTNPLDPKIQQTVFANSTHRFVLPTEQLRTFIAFNNAGFLSANFVGRIANQNLHASSQADMIIVTHPAFLSEANRLAQFRRTNDGLSVLVVQQDQIFNEFSSGIRDATAIRDFMRMFYVRANGNPDLMPKYLLIFGNGTHDNKKKKFPLGNSVITYQSFNSISPTQSYTSDDYFALLDPNEGAFAENFNSNVGLLDLAVGRIPSETLQQARNTVDKIIKYSDPATFGDWRNQVTIVADDEDGNLHLNQAEANANLIRNRRAEFNIDKIYFDAYPQISTPGGNRFPAATQALNLKVNSGTLLVNYTGHGGERGWAAERVVDLDQIRTWLAPFKMPIIFTATCSFSRWDDPGFVSAGEESLFMPNGGVSALLSTTRIVFASFNFDLNQSFLRSMFDPQFRNRKVTIGDVFKLSKNTNINGLNINSRNFSLLGDPSMPVAFPQFTVATTQINNKPSSQPDTIRALQEVTIKGFVRNANGSKNANFNGIISPTVYDKAITIQTLGQDAGSSGSFKQNFQLQPNIIYKGKASVVNGDFQFTFVVPKDISFQVGPGRISYYADNGIIDASGNYDSVFVGGINNNAVVDITGPEIQVFLNDEKFASGGIVNASPKLIVKLKDQNGINTVGTGIGHDIIARLVKADGTITEFVLNDFYEAKLDSYQEGEINFPLINLEPGNYELRVKAWDVYNNSNEQSIEFTVVNSEKLTINKVLNYPNPFTTKTAFQFEHNQPGQELDVQVKVLTISGKLIKTINTTIFTTGNRVDNIFWDGLDDFGDKIGRGVYVYQLKVRSSDGSTADKYEKLVILN